MNTIYRVENLLTREAWWTVDDYALACRLCAAIKRLTDGGAFGVVNATTGEVLA